MLLHILKSKKNIYIHTVPSAITKHDSLVGYTLFVYIAAAVHPSLALKIPHLYPRQVP